MDCFTLHCMDCRSRCAAELVPIFMSICPPKPRLCLRVGVTGHRPGEKFPIPATGVVETTVGDMLDRIKSAVESASAKYTEYFDGEASLYELVIVSSLAEGADRIVAQVGLDRGFLLDVVLPFQRDEYANDFKESKAVYFDLLKRARSVFEIEGKRTNEARAYEAAGLIMVGNVNLLIAVWDGKEPAGIGGTALIVEKAIGAHVPVVMIEPVNAKQASLLWTADHPLAPSSTRIEDLPRINDARERVVGVVDALVKPPSAGSANESLHTYMSECECRRLFPLGSVFPLFLQALFGKQIRKSDFVLRPYLSGASDDWGVFFEPSASGKSKTWPLDKRLSPRLKEMLLPAAAFADNLAVVYGSRYRGVYVSTFVLAAVAVGLALAGVYLHVPGEKIRWVVAELVTIGIFVILWLRGSLGDWHRRWLEYRRIGEWLRHLRVLSLIGAPGSIGHFVDGTLPSEWTRWYARAIRRALPVPEVLTDETYLRAIRDRVVVSEIDGQIRYNENNARRMKRMEKRIHIVGISLLAITCIIGGIFIALYLWGRDFHGRSGELELAHITFLAALLPTIGAALQAIRVQADFETVAHRSEQTVVRLKLIKKSLLEEPLDFAQLSDRIHKAVDAMTTDLDEWHVLFRTRPLAPPA